MSHLFVMAVIQKPEPWVVTEKLDRTAERTPWRGHAKRAAIQFAKQNGEMAKPAAVPSLLRWEHGAGPTTRKRFNHCICNKKKQTPKSRLAVIWSVCIKTGSEIRHQGGQITEVLSKIEPLQEWKNKALLEPELVETFNSSFILFRWMYTKQTVIIIKRNSWTKTLLYTLYKVSSTTVLMLDEDVKWERRLVHDKTVLHLSHWHLEKYDSKAFSKLWNFGTLFTFRALCWTVMYVLRLPAESLKSSYSSNSLQNLSRAHSQYKCLNLLVCVFWRELGYLWGEERGAVVWHCCISVLKRLWDMFAL